MAQDDYKEGVDYEMVDKGGYKSRRFFTKAEKGAMKNPKAEAPKANTPKANPKPKPKAKPKADKPKFSVDMAEKAIDKAASKDQPMQSSPRPKPRPVDKTPTPVKLAKPGDITVSKLDKPVKNYPSLTRVRPSLPQVGMPAAKKTTDSAVRPEGPAAGMPQDKRLAGHARATKTLQGWLSEGNLGPHRSRQLEGYITALEQESKKIRGLSADQKLKKGGMIKEGSAEDTREDKAKAKKAGMSMTKWESSAADKKHDAPKKMATGGSARGGGCATRGKGFAGTF